MPPGKERSLAVTKGALISICTGKVTGYACFHLQERGILFVGPGDEVYEGMVVGENTRDNDLVVNVTKGKQLTNVRASGSDENIILTPPRQFTLEQAIDFIQDDELVEVTPHFIRLRKRFLYRSRTQAQVNIYTIPRGINRHAKATGHKPVVCFFCLNH